MGVNIVCVIKISHFSLKRSCTVNYPSKWNIDYIECLLERQWRWVIENQLSWVQSRFCSHVTRTGLWFFLSALSY
jgi:hypothetical protein